MIIWRWGFLGGREGGIGLFVFPFVCFGGFVVCFFFLNNSAYQVENQKNYFPRNNDISAFTLSFSNTEHTQLRNIHSELRLLLSKILTANTSVYSHSSHKSTEQAPLFPHEVLRTTLINKYCKPMYVAIRK